MAQWRSGTEKTIPLEQQLELLKAELQQHREANQILQQQYQNLKNQNDRLLRKEAEHQNARTTLLQKRIIMSRAIVLVPENLVIGDRLENCTIKVYRGTNVVIADTAELINCRILGLETYADGKTQSANSKNPGTIEIKGVFYNMTPRKFAISTLDKVIIAPGARVVGNICADKIVVTELTRVKGRLATRDLVMERRYRREMSRAGAMEATAEFNQEPHEPHMNGTPEPLHTTEKIDEVIS